MCKWVFREHTNSGPPIKIKEELVRNVSFHQKLEEGEISVKHLDWLDYNSEKLEGVEYDVILGSDIVYERTYLPALCKVLRATMSLKKDNPAVAFLACTERSQTTLECFEEEMKKESLNFKIIHKGCYSPTETILSSDVRHQPTRLYSI